MGEVLVVVVVPIQLWQRREGLVLPFQLRRGRGQKVDIVERALHAVRTASRTAAGTAVAVRSQSTRAGASIGNVRMRWRHVWRGDVGVRRRAGDGPGRGHAADAAVHAAADGFLSDVDGGCMVLLAFATSRVRVVVDPRVSSELVGSAEALGAAWELAGVRLLAGMGADVPGLVLQAVKGLLADGTLVGPW
jgi:hypothetical protein